MAERFTKKDAERAFERLCQLMGVQANPPMERAPDGRGSVFATDGWRLDYAPAYGGYAIRSLTKGTTGEGEPFGSSRRSARDLWQLVNDIERAFELKKGTK